MGSVWVFTTSGLMQKMIKELVNIQMKETICDVLVDDCAAMCWSLS